MGRWFLTGLMLFVLIPASVRAQNYGGSRMSPQEATVIADYWIRSYLRRPPVQGEERQLANQLVNAPPAQVLAGLLSSQEYLRYAGGDQPAWIGQLLLDVGHRQPSPYEIQGRLQETAGLNPRAIAFEMLRENPRNWWPGPAATPPRELHYFYRQPYGGYGASNGWSY